MATANAVMKQQAGNRKIGTFKIKTVSGITSKISSHYGTKHEFLFAVNGKMWPGCTLLSAELDSKDMMKEYNEFSTSLPF